MRQSEISRFGSLDEFPSFSQEILGNSSSGNEAYQALKGYLILFSKFYWLFQRYKNLYKLLFVSVLRLLITSDLQKQTLSQIQRKKKTRIFIRYIKYNFFVQQNKEKLIAVK